MSVNRQNSTDRLNSTVNEKKKKMSSVLDILSLNYLYIIQMEIPENSKKYGSIFTQKYL